MNAIPRPAEDLDGEAWLEEERPLRRSLNGDLEGATVGPVFPAVVPLEMERILQEQKRD